MVIIDGSYLEGGGQIVRTAVSLSAITQNPVKIINIRKKRRNSGLAHQHVACVKAVKKLCNAEVEGLEVGSEILEFYPKKVSAKDFELDIKTAGSISLVIQTLLPLGLAIDKPVNITIKGGTDVKNAPPIDYIKSITLDILGKMGYCGSVDIIKRGFYPEGGGEVKLKLNPLTLKPVDLIELDKSKNKFVEGIVFNQNLDENIPRRIRKSAIDILMKNGYMPNIKIENTKGISTGVGIFLKCGTIGAHCLGERGLRSEMVGKIAVENLLKELKTGMALDKYMGDQIIPFLYYSKSTVGVSEITNHTLTNIYVVESFLDVKFNISKYCENNCNGYLIKCDVI
ncbi:RNA 3'-terminal phosphate cyclase [Methanothermococcus sp.]|uniref:RNA 3'-terminal phosphate cyclase n=1 Tax=Methanothermococcus sp. TaxID=2614238 RepID=UPI0025DB5D35|nr:RNA 3'-terminal phosphate cyclase [Methanothermococcus sp.]